VPDLGNIRFKIQRICSRRISFSITQKTMVSPYGRDQKRSDEQENRKINEERRDWTRSLQTLVVSELVSVSIFRMSVFVAFE
jgi:hypothetical protein